MELENKYDDEDDTQDPEEEKNGAEADRDSDPQHDLNHIDGDSQDDDEPNQAVGDEDVHFIEL